MLNQTDTIIRSWTKMSSLFFFSSLTSVKIVSFFSITPSGVVWCPSAAVRYVQSSSRSCCREHERRNLRLLRRARQVPLRSSAAVVFWPRWRPGWASSWPGNAAGSPRSPAPSEGPERPDADAAPPPTTCSPAHTHHLIQLWVLEILKKKQLTCYQAKLS